MLHTLGLICTVLGALVLVLVVAGALAGFALLLVALVRRTPLNISRTFAGGTLEVHTWRDGPRVTVARLRELTSCYGAETGASGQTSDQDRAGRATGGDRTRTDAAGRIGHQRTRSTYRATKDAEK